MEVISIQSIRAIQASLVGPFTNPLIFPTRKTNKFFNCNRSNPSMTEKVGIFLVEEVGEFSGLGNISTEVFGFHHQL